MGNLEDRRCVNDEKGVRTFGCLLFGSPCLIRKYVNKDIKCSQILE